MLRIKQKLNEIISLHTGKDLKQIEVDSDRDFWMSADEAKDYGIIDSVITSRKVNEKK
ncbi:MAG: ATP-dependent Clp protease proteolytic subunit [candidate division WOR-3 bacterium]